MSLIDRVFVPKKKEESEISFVRAPSARGISLRVERKLDKILAGVETIKKQLETIEWRLERLESRSQSRARGKKRNRRR